MNKETMPAEMCALVADCLALAPDKVKPTSRLIADLGADSLDFVDLIFSMEKKYGVRIREGELDFLSRLQFGAPENGAIAPEVIRRLEEWLPALKEVSDPATVTPGRLFELITVETLCIMIEQKLQHA